MKLWSASADAIGAKEDIIVGIVGMQYAMSFRDRLLVDGRCYSFDLQFEQVGNEGLLCFQDMDGDRDPIYGQAHYAFVAQSLGMFGMPTGSQHLMKSRLCSDSAVLVDVGAL